jgi:hypothetical protein
VRASTGTVLARLPTAFHFPGNAAFDGERVAVTGDGKLGLWRATDFTLLGTFSVGGGSEGMCSDGLNIWITADAPGGSRLNRF